MNQNLIISENYPELNQMLLGEELYIIDEPKWYEEINSEGGNKYRFLNIVSHPGEEILPEAQRDLFFKVINPIQTDRIKMDADGFSVINVHNYRGVQWDNLEKLFSPKYCIFWGVDPHAMGVNCKLNGGAIVNDCKIIYVNQMEVIFSNKNMKKQLWEFLKKMFKINS
jgi:hypothetical protein